MHPLGQAGPMREDTEEGLEQQWVGTEAISHTRETKRSNVGPARTSEGLRSVHQQDGSGKSLLVWQILLKPQLL